MEIVKYCLIRETLKFLELCQSYFSGGKIQVTEYYNLTRLKFQFINNVLLEDILFLKKDTDLEEELKKVFLTHCSICKFPNKIAMTQQIGN